MKLSKQIIEDLDKSGTLSEGTRRAIIASNKAKDIKKELAERKDYLSAYGEKDKLDFNVVRRALRLVELARIANKRNGGGK